MSRLGLVDKQEKNEGEAISMKSIVVTDRAARVAPDWEANAI
jgi:hypothetical protein